MGVNQRGRVRPLRLALVMCAALYDSNAQEPRLQPLYQGLVAQHQFSGILDVRELSDGNLLVTDAIDNRLLKLLIDVSHVIDVASIGSGPSQFRSVDDLHELPADTTIMSDMSNGRWLVLVDDRVVESASADDGVVGFAQSTILGFDTKHVLTLKRLDRLRLSDDLSVDSLAVVRVDRADGTADTVARIQSTPTAFPSGSGRNPLLSTAFGVAMTGPEQAIMFPDGWIAVARLEPYRVDWLRPDGFVLAGSPLPFQRVRIDEREKEEFARRAFESAGRRVSISRTRWPQFASAFGRNALFAAPDGRLIIRRQRTASSDGFAFDVIDRTGRLVNRFELPSSSRLLALGSRSIYVAETGVDGLERLAKYAWPPG